MTFASDCRARAAAVALSADRPDEDADVVLLGDIRTIFDARRVDRISTVHLLKTFSD
jgi:hypothetical protein